MLRKVYIKELKESFRDKRTLVLTVFLPIIMMSALTLFYESLVSDGGEDLLTLAVDDSISSEGENIFADAESIELVKSPDPEAMVAEGNAHAALLYSDQFIEAIEAGQEASITLIGNSFSQNSSNLMTIVSNALSAYEKTIIHERLQSQGMDATIIEPFVLEQKEISDEDTNINLIALLIPLILGLSVGIGAGPAASDLFAGEKEKKTMEALLMTPVNRSTLLYAKWLTISTLGSITGIITLIVVALEITFLTENLKKAVSFDGNGLAIIGLAILISIIYSMFIAAILMVTSIIGKTVKESQSYSTPVMMLVMFPIMMVSGIGANELSLHHFAIPMFNLFSIIKELLFGIIDYQHLLVTIGSNLVYMVVFFVIGRILFLKDKWVMN